MRDCKNKKKIAKKGTKHLNYTCFCTWVGAFTPVVIVRHIGAVAAIDIAVDGNIVNAAGTWSTGTSYCTRLSARLKKILQRK